MLYDLGLRPRVGISSFLQTQCLRAGTDSPTPPGQRFASHPSYPLLTKIQGPGIIPSPSPPSPRGGKAYTCLIVLLRYCQSAWMMSGRNTCLSSGHSTFVLVREWMLASQS